MAASHFFVGLAAGVAILSVPVLVLTPGSSLPRQVVDWIEGPPAQTLQLGPDENTAANRPLRGYQAGDPTPAAAAVPTLQPVVKPTAVPTRAPAVAAQAAPNVANVRWAGTGMIHSGGTPVTVRRYPGVDSSDDPQLNDGSPVLVGVGPPVQQAGQQWRAVRGLNGIVGWVPAAQLAVDGEAPIQIPAAAAATPTPVANLGRIANTDGSGVVLRNSPNDADRSRIGLTEGAPVTVLEASGADWLRVQADNGQTGWVPSRYVASRV